MAAGVDSQLGATFPGAPGIAGSTFLTGQSLYDSFMVNFVIPVIVDARNNSTPELGMLTKNKRSVTGKFCIQPVQDGRNTGVNAIWPEGYMPDPGSQKGFVYSFAVRDIYARIKVTAEMLRRMEGGGGFLPVDQIELEGIANDFAVLQNRMLHNDGSGRLATVNGTLGASATTITLKVNDSLEGAATCQSTVNADVRGFVLGHRIAFASSTGTIRAAAAGNGQTVTGQQAWYVSSKVGTTGITVTGNPASPNATDNLGTGSANPAIADGDWVIDASRDISMHSTAYQDTGFRQEPMGLAGIFSDAGVLDGNGISVNGQQSGINDVASTNIAANGTGFQGLPVNGAPSGWNLPVPTWNKAVVIDAAGAGARPLSETLMQKALSDANERNNANIDMLLSAYGTYNSYYDLLAGDKRFPNTLELQGGHRELSFNGLPWKKSRFAYGNRIYFVASDQFFVVENKPLSPLNMMGTPQWRWGTDVDYYWMGMMTSYNMGVLLRERAGALLNDLAQ